MQMHLIIKKLRLTTNSSTKYQWTVRTFAAIKFMRMAFNCNTDLQHKVHLKTVKNEIEYLFLCSSQYPRYWLILIHSIVYALSVASFVVRSAARCDLSIKSWYCAKKASTIHESKLCVCLRTKKIFVFSKNPRPTIILNKWILVDFVFYYNFSLLFFSSLDIFIVVCAHSIMVASKKFCAKRNSQLDIFGLRIFLFFSSKMELDIFDQKQ